MQVRCVVTGHNEKGKATVMSDTAVPPVTFNHVSGFEFHQFWGSDETMTFPDKGIEPPYHTYYPPVNGFRFTFFTIGPNSVETSDNFDVVAALQELEEKAPGMAELLEPDDPGFHTSDTIDFDYVISGEIWLELDGGEQVHLKPGDVVVMNGTRHAWRNKSDEPCVLLGCLIGAKRA